jgi:hypothetical protein
MDALAGLAGAGQFSERLLDERIHAIGLTRSLDRVTGRCLSSAYVIANRAPRHEADPAFRAKHAPAVSLEDARRRAKASAGRGLVMPRAIRIELRTGRRLPHR